MKKNTLALTFSAFITLSGSAYALDLLVVNNYQDASNPLLWKETRTDQVPSALLGNVSTKNPGSSYATIFPKSFFQESLFTVCHQNCGKNDPFIVRNGEIDNSSKTDWNVVEQSNVYFWLRSYFNFLEKNIQFKPDQYLKVLTNRELRDETKGKVMKNNAFFNPLDISLSFLPASKNIFFQLLGGKINRSGYDPSVVVHEASHYVFHHLFPDAINDEISGLNEGFADYMANVFLNSPKVGLVMLQGRALRDSSTEVDGNKKLKTYEPKMEVHDLGERVSYALWRTRELSTNKSEMDRLVIDAIIDLSGNPYATVHDFKNEMLKRLPVVINPQDMKTAESFWQMTLSGSPAKIGDLQFLDRPINNRPIMGFQKTQIIPENLAREYGVSPVEESNFSILQLEKINEKQIAILMGTNTESRPYWIAFDKERSNVLGIYDSADKTLVTDTEDLKRIKFLADQGKDAANLIQDFTSKIDGFTKLVQGKGTFNLLYKVKSKSSSSKSFVFNGKVQSGEKIRLELKRKLLTGALLGMPDIEAIELYLLPLPGIKDLPELNGLQVIGYKMALKTGTQTEVMLDSYGN